MRTRRLRLPPTPLPSLLVLRLGACWTSLAGRAPAGAFCTPAKVEERFGGRWRGILASGGVEEVALAPAAAIEPAAGGAEGADPAAQPCFAPCPAPPPAALPLPSGDALGPVPDCVGMGGVGRLYIPPLALFLSSLKCDTWPAGLEFSGSEITLTSVSLLGLGPLTTLGVIELGCWEDLGGKAATGGLPAPDAPVWTTEPALVGCCRSSAAGMLGADVPCSASPPWLLSGMEFVDSLAALGLRGPVVEPPTTGRSSLVLKCLLGAATRRDAMSEPSSSSCFLRDFALGLAPLGGESLPKSGMVGRGTGWRTGAGGFGGGSRLMSEMRLSASLVPSPGRWNRLKL